MEKTKCDKSFLERLGFITNRTLYKQIGKLMATVEELTTKLDDIQTVVGNVSGDVDSLLAQIAALIAELAAGHPVSQEQLDALDTKAQAIKDSLSAVDAKEPSTPVGGSLGGKRSYSK